MYLEATVGFFKATICIERVDLVGYTFKDITDELFKQIKSEDWTEQDVVHNFYISQTKNFKEIISTINLEEEIEWIKTGGNFSFNESDRDFWINVLKDFTKKWIR